MLPPKFLTLFALALPSFALFTKRSVDDDLLVQTNFLTVRGVPWPNATSVRFFGAIPYAEPPLGNARWQPPITKGPVEGIIDGSWFGPSCIQYDNGVKSLYNSKMTGYSLTPGQAQSEDCLTLAIWAPRVPKPTGSISKELLPVMIWIHGGSFVTGGAASPYKYGDKLVRDQNVIMVSMNYRLNIWGYPNAAALAGSNLNPGLLDQRKAVEWVHQNIAFFGGDPERMTLFGQSAGSQSMDTYTHAWPSDPIVKGFIGQSGTIGNLVYDLGHSNFSYVASRLNCSSASKDDEFACMQKVDWNKIMNVYNSYNASLHDDIPLAFYPTADNITGFGNYTARKERGLFARLPTLITQVDNEGSSLVAYHTEGPNETSVKEFTLDKVTCPAAFVTKARTKFDVPVWRTRYFGVWPNLNPFPWLGAYHSSDEGLIFDTADIMGLGPDTELQRKTGKYMQDAFGAFARDPVKGLVDFGWPVYDANGSALIKLAYEGNVKAVIGKSTEYDQDC